ncbi:L-rhamnose mutarotase [Sansalvadorimonas verongulae]|uniref:L-rhamnose mutarotase n=1 Tax=Sansalvadorimonas verongulae TaxID=2172824 RepID=UPI0012BBBAD0|nr:L-rhamnose mutarotase [Sansalvadorimonas verongulae]MTI15202.1 L-rhamnose mutarotase [Sansalvadorimonas verongulae]
MTDNDAAYGPTNPDLHHQRCSGVQRFASVTGLNPEKESYYRELHTRVWDGVLERLKASNIRNYSIHITQIDGRSLLFSYLEYTGDDYVADIKRIAEDPVTQKWWKETDPCQIPLSGCGGNPWKPMEMVFLME